MNARKLILGKIFMVVSSIGALFVLAEIIMQSIGKSICLTTGCRLAAQTVRFGEISILATGFLMFASLAALSAVSLRFTNPIYERLINILVITSLACEGFFMGYLTFRLYAVCVFCVIVFGFLITLGTLRLIAREYEVIAGFAVLAAVFTLFYLVQPVGITATLPENGRFFLFYSKDCKYCDETKTQLEKEKIPVIYLEANAYRGLLKGLGIEHVPTLVVNDRYEKAVFVGQEAIKRYLLACSQSDQSVKRPRMNAKPSTADRLKPMNNGELKMDFFTAGTVISRPEDTASGGGLCKQDEICK
jgi:hypothetical protein